MSIWKWCGRVNSDTTLEYLISFKPDEGYLSFDRRGRVFVGTGIHVEDVLKSSPDWEQIDDSHDSA
jgi:hypothetical protein